MRGDVEVTRLSFVVPTLNRAGYVNRAVRSCLSQASDGVEVEVLVLDSTSDDSSWSDLVDEFGNDPRVRLRQNARTSGPMRSWLDAATEATGEWITFVWSDDYIFPAFSESLIASGADDLSVAFGRGLVRPIECDSIPHFTVSAVTKLSLEVAFAGFMSSHGSRGNWPVSPACALFSAEAFRRWMADVEVWSRASSTRQAIMWRSAIGPDLLLFLVAASEGHCGRTDREVAQFSSHSGSITVSSSNWPLATGYWLARATAIQQGWVAALDDRVTRRNIYATNLAQGFKCLISAPPSFKDVDRRQVIPQLLSEWSRVATTGRRDVGATALFYAIAKLLLVRVVSRSPLSRAGF